MNKLPTKEQYQATLVATNFGEWSEPLYQCPKCGGAMRRNEMIVLTSCPAKYQYRCDDCKYEECF